MPSIKILTTVRQRKRESGGKVDTIEENKTECALNVETKLEVDHRCHLEPLITIYAFG